MARHELRQVWGQTWPLACLCVLVASRWMAEAGDPRFASTLSTQAVGCLIAAFTLLASGLSRMRPVRERPEGAAKCRAAAMAALGTGMILAGPLCGELIAGQHLGSSSATLALALTPTVVAIAAIAGPGAQPGDLAGRLWPGLAGLTGLLLLLPEPTFTGPRAWLGLASTPLSIGAGAVLVSRGEDALSHAVRTSSMACGCFASGAVFAGSALAQRLPLRGDFRAIALDTCVFVLSLVLLQRSGCSRWSSQFLLIPLLSLGEGLMFLRPLLGLRSWLGLGILATGAVRQLFPSADDPEPVPSLGESLSRR